MALEYASEKLRDDKNIVLEAFNKQIGQRNSVLQYASERLQHDRDILTAAGIGTPSIDDVIADAKKWCAEHNTPSSGKMELER